MAHVAQPYQPDYPECERGWVGAESSREKELCRKGRDLRMGRHRIPVCGDCGAYEGHLHQLGCDTEICPYCAGQLLSCGCAYDVLQLRDPVRYGVETHHLSPALYTHGLTDDQEATWITLLMKKGRIPYIQYPLLCGRCGKQWPELFFVSDTEWRRYVQPDQRGSLLCQACYETIKARIDGASYLRVVTCEVTIQECPWLTETLLPGTLVYLYPGATFGCCGPDGIAVSWTFGQEPFFELPRTAVGRLPLPRRD